VVLLDVGIEEVSAGGFAAWVEVDHKEDIRGSVHSVVGGLPSFSAGREMAQKWHTLLCHRPVASRDIQMKLADQRNF